MDVEQRQVQTSGAALGSLLSWEHVEPALDSRGEGLGFWAEGLGLGFAMMLRCSDEAYATHVWMARCSATCSMVPERKLWGFCVDIKRDRYGSGLG